MTLVPTLIIIVDILRFKFYATSDSINRLKGKEETDAAAKSDRKYRKQVTQQENCGNLHASIFVEPRPYQGLSQVGLWSKSRSSSE